MIISASRRTDIPAFFPQWFMKRIDAGYFVRVNPFNPSQTSRVSLLPEDVDVIVFWTKNPKPLLPLLSDLDNRGFRYYFQFTLNDYPNLFEPNVPPLPERLDTFCALSDTIGKARVIWRYDPIIISTITPPNYHVDSFGRIAEKVADRTERVIISFLDLYAKLRKRLDKLQRSHGIAIEDTTLAGNSHRALKLGQQLSQTALKTGLEISSCCEPNVFEEVGIKPGACIDGTLIERLWGIKDPGKDPSQRRACLCAKAIDMGTYNTCYHGCVYCYANCSVETVKRRSVNHDPDSPTLVLKGKTGI